MPSSDLGRPSCRSALIVTDANLADARVLRSADRCPGRSASRRDRSSFPPGEATKCLAQAGALLYDQLVAQRPIATPLIVALGGGVIGDLAGFVAATYRPRASRWSWSRRPCWPRSTARSAARSASIIPRAKNIIGAFHQPVGVWIDTDDARHAARPRAPLRPGRGRQVRRDPRRRVLRGAGGRAPTRSSAASPTALRRIVARSCRLKADVVVARRARGDRAARRAQLRPHDRPRDRGGRRLRRPVPARRGRGRRAWSPRPGWPSGWAGSSPRRRRPTDRPARALRPADVGARARSRARCSRPWAATRRTARARSASSCRGRSATSS